jgi:anti-anti-sigma factor
MSADAYLVTTPDVGLREVARPEPAMLPFEARLASVTEHVALVSVCGEIDFYTAPRVGDAVAQGLGRGAQAVVFDLREVSFIDATGLAVAVAAVRSLGPGSVAIACPRAGIARVFRICGLDGVLGICATLEDALLGLRTAPASVPSFREDVWYQVPRGVVECV